MKNKSFTINTLNLTKRHTLHGDMQGSGTSSSETIASLLSRDCNFSSNIINDTLKSIFVNTCICMDGVPLPLEGRGKDDNFYSISTASTANRAVVLSGGVRNSIRKKINPFNVSTKYVFAYIEIGFLYFLYPAFRFLSLHSQYICPEASGSVRTWNRVWMYLCLFSSTLPFFFSFFIESISV